jgi:hypothetical protein
MTIPSSIHAANLMLYLEVTKETFRKNFLHYRVHNRPLQFQSTPNYPSYLSSVARNYASA